MRAARVPVRLSRRRSSSRIESSRNELGVGKVFSLSLLGGDSSTNHDQGSSHRTEQNRASELQSIRVVTSMRAPVGDEDAAASSSSATADRAGADRAGAFGARTRVCYGVLTFDDRRESQRKVPVRCVVQRAWRSRLTCRRRRRRRRRVDVLWGVVSKRTGAAARASHAAHRGCVGEVQVYVRGRGSARGSVL